MLNINKESVQQSIRLDWLSCVKYSQNGCTAARKENCISVQVFCVHFVYCVETKILKEQNTQVFLAKRTFTNDLFSIIILILCVCVCVCVCVCERERERERERV